MLYCFNTAMIVKGSWLYLRVSRGVCTVLSDVTVPPCRLLILDDDPAWLFVSLGPLKTGWTIAPSMRTNTSAWITCITASSSGINESTVVWSQACLAGSTGSRSACWMRASCSLVSTRTCPTWTLLQQRIRAHLRTFHSITCGHVPSQ